MFVARKDDRTACPVPSPSPHVGGPLINAMPVHFFVDGRPVIRLADFARCEAPAPLDVVASGAACLIVCGLPLARFGDAMIHAGRIVQGSPNFLVGGPSFALPTNYKIVGPADFQNKVIRDLFMLSTTPSGRSLLDELGSRGHDLTIEPESNPHNSFCRAHDGAKSQDGTGAGSTVKYNPEVAIWLFDSGGNKIAAAPQLVLGHELVHALNNARGTHKPGHEDPKQKLGPVSQPDIAFEEEQTIGTGQYSNVSPSENSIRKDLGLPRRDNHGGDDGVVRKEESFLWGLFKKTVEDRSGELKSPTGDLRPGAC